MKHSAMKKAGAVACAVGATVAMSAGTARAQTVGSVSTDSVQFFAQPQNAVNASIVLPVGSAVFGWCALSGNACP